MKQMRQEIHRLRQCGPTRILLFSNLPVARTMAAEALLDNGPEVIVHHYFNGIYLPVLRLAHETVGLSRVNITDHRPPPLRAGCSVWHASWNGGPVVARSRYSSSRETG